jgi:hypothetical protein
VGKSDLHAGQLHFDRRSLRDSKIPPYRLKCGDKTSPEGRCGHQEMARPGEGVKRYISAPLTRRCAAPSPFRRGICPLVPQFISRGTSSY